MYHWMSKKRSAGVLVSRSLLLLALLLLLPGCATQVTYLRELPPVELMANCPEVVEQYKTNGELANTVLAYRKALELCNLDKQSLREWAKE